MKNQEERDSYEKEMDAKGTTVNNSTNNLSFN